MKWLLEPHPDFPSAAQLAARVAEPILIERGATGLYAWPEIAPPVVLYGTMRMVTHALRQPALANSVFDSYPALRCSSYYRQVYELLGRTAVLLPLTALPHVDLHRMLGARVFVRPDSNFKLFTARIVEADALAAFVAEEHVHRDELVVVSEVVALGPEYRCICRAGRVICHSSYPAEPYAPAPPEAIAFAEQVAARLEEPFVTIDVALGDRPRLVEVGGVNSWGLYGCDPDAFIAAMEAEALAR